MQGAVTAPSNVQLGQQQRGLLPPCLELAWQQPPCPPPLGWYGAPPGALGVERFVLPRAKDLWEKVGQDAAQHEVGVCAAHATNHVAWRCCQLQLPCSFFLQPGSMRTQQGARGRRGDGIQGLQQAVCGLRWGSVVCRGARVRREGQVCLVADGAAALLACDGQIAALAVADGARVRARRLGSHLPAGMRGTRAAQPMRAHTAPSSCVRPLKETAPFCVTAPLGPHMRRCGMLAPLQ